MKKALIFTLYGNHNYGNKLQNIAVQELLSNYDIDCKTVIFPKLKKNRFKNFIKKIIKILIPKYNKILRLDKIRKSKFILFDKYIKKINFKNINLEEFNYIFVGSDQVWNPADDLSQQLVSYLNKIEKKPIISISASIAVEKIPEKYIEKYRKQFLKIDYLSTREEEGKKIIIDLTNRKDINVLIDPTMILSRDKWDSYIKKPAMLKNDKFILSYFLGELSDIRKSEIERIAKENNCEIINILDKNSPFYECNPSEFLYLEKNAFLICTDSFHSCVFAILYNRPFVVFDREQNDIPKMNSRIDTLISKFKLKNRKYNGKKITLENLKHDYNETYIILEKERKKFDEFLTNALDSDVN